MSWKAKPRIVGSPEQETIWRFMQRQEEHGLVVARAGTGKTFTIEHGLKKLIGKRVLYAAFGVSTVEEAKRRIGQRVCDIRTTHGVGFHILRENIEGIEFEEDKGWRILKEIAPDFGFSGRQAWRRGERPTLIRLIDLARSNGVMLSEDMLVRGEYDPQHADVSNWQASLYEIMQHHSLELPFGLDRYAPLLMEIMRRHAFEKTRVDYGDMIWLPLQLDLSVKRWDVLMGDEVQDWNIAQTTLALRCGERLICVGDPDQSIYGFRGADVQSMDRLERALGSQERGLVKFPLTECRRCGQAQITLAQTLVPDIRWREQCGEGLIESIDHETFLRDLTAGETVLCRTNAPLVSLLYQLFAMGKRAYILGRNVGDRLMALVDRLQGEWEVTNDASGVDIERYPFGLPELNGMVDTYEQRELLKLEQRRNSASARITLKDRCDCLRVLVDQARSLPDLQQKMKFLFADKDRRGQIQLSTIHRFKGLENEVVYVLEPGLIPHYMATSAWEQEQEEHLAYVMATRAKAPRSVTRFVGGVPRLFGGNAQVRELPRTGDMVVRDGAVGGAIQQLLDNPIELEDE